MGHAWAALLLAATFLCAAGCSEPPGATVLPVTTTALPGTPVPVTPEQPSDMALQPEELPGGYVLQDRSVMALQEVSPLARELGWRQGYYVSYKRENANTGDFTLIRQSVSIYSDETIDGVFLLAKEDLKNQQLSPSSRYEIPFPPAGDRSIAFRDSNPLDTDRPVTYTVIFTRKNVFEKITMTGTNTDYETLRRLVERAVMRIR